ncbi:holin [Lacticaseibacillus paracasei]|uniref:Holin n=1 Tax=Lacticaseibacillus paracasei NRIC 0644 TaxID=1435038 RepID=A0A0C9NWY6_LACPA|nr:holin [Lacticaseibacillus paracasei]GAN36485.1 putative uncharacterized protein [Lacticaseibacillus paracasei NRIC 0644]GAN39252.1 putative uncharacterized protein [Lacticaseibacillus paracasei NRIC 1917]
MDMISQLNLGTAAELAITAAIILAMVQAIKQTKLDNKWLPWLAMSLGVVAGLISVAVTGGQNWASGAVMGFLVGAATSGLFDGVKSASVAVSDRQNKVADLQAKVTDLTAELEKLKTADQDRAAAVTENQEANNG